MDEFFIISFDSFDEIINSLIDKFSNEFCLIFVVLILIIIFLRLEHLSKHFSPIDLTDDGIIISSSDEQPMNDCSPIDVIVDGIIIFLSDEHPFINSFGIFVIFFERINCSIPSKTFSPIDLTEDGIVISLSDVQPLNDLEPID